MRVMVKLNTEEHGALIALAYREYRDPRDQAALIIRDFLIECGLLSTDPIPTQPARIEPAEVEHEHA